MPESALLSSCLSQRPPLPSPAFRLGDLLVRPAMFSGVPDTKPSLHGSLCLEDPPLPCQVAEQSPLKADPQRPVNVPNPWTGPVLPFAPRELYGHPPELCQSMLSKAAASVTSSRVSPVYLWAVGVASGSAGPVTGMRRKEAPPEGARRVSSTRKPAAPLRRQQPAGGAGRSPGRLTRRGPGRQEMGNGRTAGRSDGHSLVPC